MFKHLFRLIWNKKKQNFLLILEIFISFIGMCAGFMFMLYPYTNYKMPAGFEDENVWLINYDSAREINRDLKKSFPAEAGAPPPADGLKQDKPSDSLRIFHESVKSVLLSMNKIEGVTYSSSNVPFSGNSSNTDVTYNANRTFASVYSVDDSYLDVMGMDLLYGRWFSVADDAAKYKPIVINEALRSRLFNGEDALGKIVVSDASPEMKIIGVVANFKYESEFEEPDPGFFMRIDTGNIAYNNTLMIKVRPGADAVFEGAVHKTLSNTIRNADIEISRITDLKAVKRRELIVPLLIFFVVSGFLIINVALGLFGVFWYNTTRRKAEIGLRRAVGATGGAIMRQVVGEAIVLCTLAVGLGLLFAVQFPLLNVFESIGESFDPALYIKAIILSVTFIYLLVIICAYYPGRQAAGIYPATALHED